MKQEIYLRSQLNMEHDKDLNKMKRNQKPPTQEENQKADERLAKEADVVTQDFAKKIAAANVYRRFIESQKKKTRASSRS